MVNLNNIPTEPFTLPELYKHWGVAPKKQSVPYSSQVRRELVRAGYIEKQGKWRKRDD